MKITLWLTMGLLIAGTASIEAADVKVNWTKHCAKCHGEDGKGQTSAGKRLKAKDYTNPKVQASFKDEEAFKITKEGKNRMRGYAALLSDQEIKDLIVYVRKFKK
ncbi:MAG TPA: cytochrome c [Verrucomicrobiota bacterium]|nr:cytochrome c [Verrucomicrobiota bacterium]